MELAARMTPGGGSNGEECLASGFVNSAVSLHIKFNFPVHFPYCAW